MKLLLAILALQLATRPAHFCPMDHTRMEAGKCVTTTEGQELCIWQHSRTLSENGTTITLTHSFEDSFDPDPSPLTLKVKAVCTHDGKPCEGTTWLTSLTRK